MIPEQFHKYIIVPSLKAVNWWGEASEFLMLATPLKESNLEKLVQDNGGPAKGPYQMEDPTFNWLQKKLNEKDNLQKKISIITACHFESMPDSDTMIYNFRFAVLMARFRYLEVTAPLPDKDDIEGMTNYYVKYYNGGGKSTFENSLPYFQKAYHICKNTWS